MATFEPSADERSGAPSVDRPRLLVVEDDDTIAVPLDEGLRREGFDVTRVHSGADALATAAGADLVLLDLGLPEITSLAMRWLPRR